MQIQLETEACKVHLMQRGQAANQKLAEISTPTQDQDGFLLFSLHNITELTLQAKVRDLSTCLL